MSGLLSFSWGTVIDQLAADHTVVLPDLSGSGASPLPGNSEPLDIDTIADQIAATAHAAGLERYEDPRQTGDALVAFLATLGG